MLRISWLVPLLALAACDNRGADGYTFEEPEFERHEVAVSVKLYPSVAELRRAFPQELDDSTKLKAWGTVTRSPAACTIHAVDPRETYAPEWLGHELAHCLYGRWHPQGR